MKNAYENFMQIKLSDNDLNLINEYSVDNFAEDLELDIYSKIVVQFHLEVEYDRFEFDAPDTDEFVICHDFDYNKKQYIMYALDENAFNDAIKIFDKYECNIYQFIIENYNIYEPDKDDEDDEDDNLPF